MKVTVVGVAGQLLMLEAVLALENLGGRLFSGEF